MAGSRLNLPLAFRLLSPPLLQGITKRTPPAEHRPTLARGCARGGGCSDAMIQRCRRCVRCAPQMCMWGTITSDGRLAVELAAKWLGGRRRGLRAVFLPLNREWYMLYG